MCSYDIKQISCREGKLIYSKPTNLVVGLWKCTNRPTSLECLFSLFLNSTISTDLSNWQNSEGNISNTKHSFTSNSDISTHRLPYGPWKGLLHPRKLKCLHFFHGFLIFVPLQKSNHSLFRSVTLWYSTLPFKFWWL
jgi:hypothetical protein